MKMKTAIRILCFFTVLLLLSLAMLSCNTNREESSTEPSTSASAEELAKQALLARWKELVIDGTLPMKEVRMPDRDYASGFFDSGFTTFKICNAKEDLEQIRKYLKSFAPSIVGCRDSLSSGLRIMKLIDEKGREAFQCRVTENGELVIQDVLQRIEYYTAPNTVTSEAFWEAVSSYLDNHSDIASE